jgi:hypothetical protein
MPPVVSSADEIGEALRWTILGSMPVRPPRNELPEGFPLPPDSDVLVIDGVEPGRVLEHWRAARDALPSTSRWPIAVAPGAHGGFRQVPDDELAALEGAIVGMDDSRMFPRFVFDVPRAQEVWREGLEHVFPGAGLLAMMAAELPDPVLDREVDRWIHDRLMADPSLVALVEERLQSHIGTRAWFDPDTVELALLPTTSPWLAIEWVSYFGAYGDPPAFVAALKRWHSTWGAELVAAWGTMLQFTVTRRPQQGEEAWELAGQVLAWAGSLQMSQWELALVLARSDTWFLHDRP